MRLGILAGNYPSRRALLLLNMSGVTQVRTHPAAWSLEKSQSNYPLDQDPIPPKRRTWTGWTFVLYWFSDLVTYSTWASGSSVVALGLSPSDAIWIVFVAAMCNAIPTVMNGAIGADLHIVSILQEIRLIDMN